MSYADSEMSSSLAERIDSLSTVAKNLESSFQLEREKTGKLQQEILSQKQENLELKKRIDVEAAEIKNRWEKEWNDLRARAQGEFERIQNHYQNVIREMGAAQNEQKQKEEQLRIEVSNSKFFLKQATEKFSELQNQHTSTQELLSAAQNEVRLFRDAWAQVLQREEVAKKVISREAALISEMKNREIQVQSMQEQLIEQKALTAESIKNQQQRIAHFQEECKRLESKYQIAAKTSESRTSRIKQLESLLKLKEDCSIEKYSELSKQHDTALELLETERNKRKSIEIELEKAKFDLEGYRESLSAMKIQEKEKSTILLSTLRKEVEQLAMVHPLRDIVDMKDREIEGLKSEIDSLDADDEYRGKLKSSLKRISQEMKDAKKRLSEAEAIHVEMKEKLSQEPVLETK